jgi:hypothetical protein
MTERDGVRACIDIVKARQRLYESYRCTCGREANGHRVDCPGASMMTQPATFATLDEILVFLEAHLERLSSAWPAFLTLNLYLAATLCRSFEIGVYAAASWTSGQLDGQNAWEPGCGRNSSP